MKTLWIGFGLLLLVSSSVMAGEVLFVPPDVFYLAGGEAVADTATLVGAELENQTNYREFRKDKNRIMFDELGRSAYLALTDAVATFNGSSVALRNRRHYSAISMAYPSYQNNLKIKKFYRDLAVPGMTLLRNIKEKNKINAIIWTDFYSKDITACLSGSSKQCNVSNAINLFDGDRVITRNVKLVFEKKNHKFTSDSLDELSREVVALFHEVGPPMKVD